MWSTILVMLLLSPVAVARDDGFKPVTIRFESSLDAALERAKKEKIPVMVCVIMDDEPANDSILAGHYRDKELGEDSRHAACVIANSKTHPEMDETVGGATRQVCSKFGSVTCAEHQAIEMEVRKRWIPGELTIAPQHLFIDPTGKELVRHAYFLDLSKLQKMLKVARYLVDATSVDRAGIEKELHDAQDQYKNALSKNESVRQPAIDALASYEDPRAFKLLCDLAKGKTDDNIRLEAIKAMSQKGSYRALPVLLDLLKEKKVLVRNHVVVAIERVRLPDAAPALIKLYKTETSERVQGSILRAIARCAPNDPAVKALVLKESSNKNYLVRLDDAVALGFLKTDADVLAVLRKMAGGDDNSNLRGVGTWALAMHQDKGAVDVLKQLAAADKVLEVRQAATRALEVIAQPKVEEDFESGYKSFVVDEVTR